MKMKCIWCDHETTVNKLSANDKKRYANKEHIFPKSLGGEKTLPQGLVCEVCNTKFDHEIESRLRKHSKEFMELYQKSSLIKGKPIGRVRAGNKQKIKESEIFDIFNSNGFKIVRDKINPLNQVAYINANLANELKYDLLISRAIHKCAFNALLDFKEYDYTFKNYQPLKSFVYDPNEVESCKWSYAVCYSQNNLAVKFAPQYIPLLSVDSADVLAMILIFPTVIYLVGLKPAILSSTGLKGIVDILPDFAGLLNLNGFDYKNHYKKSHKLMGFNKTSFSNPINDLEFELFVNPKFFEASNETSCQLLTNCDVCFNTTPINFSIAKSMNLNKFSEFSGFSYCLHCGAEIELKNRELFIEK
jgi:HNH endonuclease